MWPLFQTITDLAAGVDVVRRRRFGRIVVARGQLVGIEYRPYSSAVSRVGVWWSRRSMLRGAADRCELYFDQPSPHPAFLVVRLIVASPATRLASIGCAMRTLDFVAKVKGASAALAHVTLDRITDPVAARFGWDRHCLSWRGRHYIKRYDSDAARLEGTGPTHVARPGVDPTRFAVDAPVAP